MTKSEGLEGQYRFLINRALNENEPELAERLAHWAKSHWAINVDDALKLNKADEH